MLVLTGAAGSDGYVWSWRSCRLRKGPSVPIMLLVLKAGQLLTKVRIKNSFTAHWCNYREGEEKVTSENCGKSMPLLWRDRMDVPSRCTIVKTMSRASVQA
jgi:hypothetical protein